MSPSLVSAGVNRLAQADVKTNQDRAKSSVCGFMSLKISIGHYFSLPLEAGQSFGPRMVRVELWSNSIR